jgi:mannose/fructose-specific phosphotransferase system component IIA
MSEPGATLRGVIVCHGTLADGYVDAVRQITGVGEDVLVALSNRGLSPESMGAAIRGAVGTGPAIIFTDLTSGSCGFAARRLCHQMEQVAVISAVNLPMLLHFVMHRDESLAQLVPLLVDKGRTAIDCAPAAYQGTGDHGDRALPR